MAKAHAGEMEIERLEQVFGAPTLEETLFSARFLMAVPTKRLQSIIRDVEDRYGEMLSVRQDSERYLVETETHSIPVEIKLDQDGLIVGLLIKPAEPKTASFEETLAAIAATPGEVSYLVRRENVPDFALSAERRLAVGSAFKLGVLAVLMDDLNAGRRSWDDVMRLEERDRSLPSGRLQDFPSGAPFTLHTLAAAMIAESDNTATDMLIRLLGRDRIAERLGLNTLLTTRAFFHLKADPELAARYAAGNSQERLILLEDLEWRKLPEVEDVTGPHHQGVEWYVPVEQLCELAIEVAHLDIFTLNPGPVRTANWNRVAYKGGSEPGVLNLTAALRHADGDTSCISVSVNAETPIDETAVSSLFARLASQLSEPLP
ncbi:serine hydrolase [Hoeflea phototrophica]|jgi:beta-lactamase class A|nr:serine hydrolase [Hoeflea phototrophica]